MRKVIVIIVGCAVLACFISGCARVSGLDEQLIASGIGVDKNENIYEITVQALNINDTSEEDSSSNKIISISAKGNSLLEAITSIENQSGKELLYSHDLILVIGNDTAKSGISDIVKFFATNHKLRPTVEVLISNTPAKDILSVGDSEKSLNSEDILSIVTVGKEGNDGIKSNIRYLLGDLNDSYKNAKAWYLEFDADSNVLLCEKVAIFKDEKLVGVLDNDKTKGLLLIYGKAKNISDYININEKFVSYDIKKVDSHIKVDIQNDHPIFNIVMDIDIDLYGVDDNSDDVIKKDIDERLKYLVSNAVYECIEKYKCDIFNFNRYIMNADLNYFKSYKDKIDDVLNSSKYNISTNAKIKYMESNQKINSLVY